MTRRATDPIARARKARALDIMASNVWRCWGCGDKHGTMIEQPDGSYYRIELKIVHIDSNRENWRRSNLRAHCQACRGQQTVQGSGFRAPGVGAQHAVPAVGGAGVPARTGRFMEATQPKEESA